MVWRSNRSRNILVYGSTGLIRDYSSDSEGEFVEEEKPWPPEERTGRPKWRAPRVPRPHSHLFRTSSGRRARGNKHARRWENSMYLSTLHQIPEEEWEEGVTILPPHTSSFAKLFTSSTCMQVWCDFTARPEEEQQQILSSASESRVGGEESESEPGEKCFKRINRRIRAALKHNRHLPLPLLRETEEELCFHFSQDHTVLVALLPTHPFYRLLVHAVCQYTGLHSTTELYQGTSMVLVECRRKQFTPPCTTLVHHLGPH